MLPLAVHSCYIKRKNSTSVIYWPLPTDLRDQVQRKIDKILEPPPVKAPKPLPRPDDAPRKKRGGRRYV